MHCENCVKEHDGEYGAGRFCSARCARSWSTRSKRDQINQQVSDKLRSRPSVIDEIDDLISDDVIRKLFRSYPSKAQIAQQIKQYTGIGHSMSTFQRFLDRKIKELGLDVETLGSYNTFKYEGPESVFRRRHKTKRSLLERALLAVGRQQICQACECQATWQGKPLILQIDHVNGNPVDNREENLRFLCPNCHSQTLLGVVETSDQLELPSSLE